uniref:Nicotinate-nucleotide--dimethylbenzimidazole phosphoribosyltransferase n=1 Tax=Magnetococcus massalia (strain MO-1) TaxID=451514 RepID=A0A1S7LMW4_MAGMO|nr:Nicotinate-nucleotide--dimethylbenzimidazole phosphoribosyltransferase (anaerobic pathway of cobalamin biosynthesis, cobT) [Candidatus Magnetococcus massalia]
MMIPTWIQQPIQDVDGPAQELARQRQGSLTKPPGSLGRLEEIAIHLAGLQGVEKPQLQQIVITIFAADHGVAAAGVSAFPQSVTVEMIRNFSRGGAAISVLARQLGAKLEVVDVGALEDPGDLPGVIRQRAGAGTVDFRQAPAMDEGQLEQALAAGYDAVERAAELETELFIAGEMGIGNTTAASALLAALAELAPIQVVGPGTGVDAEGMQRKRSAIEEALAHHKDHLSHPLEVLQRLGGFEIAAMAGAYLRAGQRGIPLLVDGFISSVAALVAVRLKPELHPWLLLSHSSAEPAYGLLAAQLNQTPLLDFGMRLGEGSGAAVTVPLLQLACRLHSEMATFAEAGISGG